LKIFWAKAKISNNQPTSVEGENQLEEEIWRIPSIGYYFENSAA